MKKRGISEEEMNAQRRSCGISRNDRIRNEVIKKWKLVRQLRGNTEKTAHLVWTCEKNG